jgi:hypothetical protein
VTTDRLDEKTLEDLKRLVEVWLPTPEWLQGRRMPVPGEPAREYLDKATAALPLLLAEVQASRARSAFSILVDAMTDAKTSHRPVEVDFTHEATGDRFVMVVREWPGPGSSADPLHAEIAEWRRIAAAIPDELAGERVAIYRCASRVEALLSAPGSSAERAAGDADGFPHCSECGVVIHCAGTGSPHPDLRGAAKDLLAEVRHVPGLSSAGAIRLVEAAQRVERLLAAPPSAERADPGALRRVLSDFLTLTWWAEGGCSILVHDKRRSGSEVRELINLRASAARALSGDAGPGGKATP